GSNLQVTESYINQNQAINGGGMYSDSSEYQIILGGFSGNEADVSGGGIYQRLGTANISGVQFNNNSGSLGLSNPASTGGGISCEDANLILSDLNFINNYADNAGGGIYVDSSSFLMQGCHFSFNEADNGGGIYIYNSPGILIDSTEILDCMAWEDGGGIFLIDCINPVITNSNVEDNFAPHYGGGIRLMNCPNSNIMNCQINNNQAYYNGGGINIENSSNVMIDSCSFLNCQVFEKGGGVCFDNSTGTMNICEIDSCSADFGGGLYAFGSNLQVTESYINQNQATKGGGLYSDSCEYQIKGGGFSGNWAYGDGGGIYQRLGIADISGVQFFGNLADQSSMFGNGGAIFCEDANLTLSDLNFTSNCALKDGGGIFSSGSILNLNNVEFNSNSVWINGSHGGGMYVYDSPHCNLVDVHFLNNYADWGAGFCCSGSSISIFNVEFLSNTALLTGGGLKSWGSTLDLNNVKFNNNLAPDPYLGEGGSMHVHGSSIYMLNVEMSNNMSFINGGGICMYGNSSLEATNTTFVNNSSGSGTAIFAESGSSANLLNDIIWQHTAPAFAGAGSFTINYSDIEGGWTGTGNIDSDPLFVDPGMDDYNLSWLNFPIPDATKSPCIDAGDPASPKDPDSTWSDMGAFYFHQDHTLLTGGNISDTLFCSESPYFVVGDLTIPVGEELLIEPCVRMIFQGDYRLQVEGKLLALGNETDSIYFYPSDTINGWQGIRYYDQNTNGQDSSRMKFCNIWYGNANGIDADSTGGGLYFNNSSDVLIKNSNIGHNKARLGGGIYVNHSSTPKILNNNFENNIAEYGGGIYIDSSNCKIEECSISFNYANTDGGGIYFNDYAQPELLYSTVNNHYAQNYGGGVYTDSSNFEIAHCQIYENTAYRHGGGILQIYAESYLMSNHIYDNLAMNGYQGGGIHVSHSTAIILKTTIEGNKTTGGGGGAGGGIASLYSNIIIDSSMIRNNESRSGGGIYINFGQFTITNSEFKYNTTSYEGGAICYRLTEGNLINSLIFENSSIYGGGINCFGSPISFVNVNILNNESASSGGGFLIYSS
ncbi:MAG: right-handed parallel beta-helix repeat-containing protein, partial [Bacteroidales bacterium]|nr:right-handed parallel beta-helix repeat-containing protein [Bacteroidales bacterium]